MATNSLSVKQCDISYLVVYQNWIRNDRDRNKGESTIPITEIVRNMRLDTLLKKSEYQIVKRQKTDDEKLMTLFTDYMPGRGEEGFKQVVDSLYQNKYDDFANDLVAQRQKFILQSLTEDFANKLNVGKILPYLKETNHFSDSDMQQITSASPSEAHLVVINIVGRKCPGAFGPFYMCLLKAQQFHLAELIYSCVPKLFSEIMPAIGEKGFNQLMKILNENNYNDLAKDLAAERDKSLTDVSTAVQTPQMKLAQTHLSRLIQENVDFMAKYWSDFIPIAQTETAFVDVQVLEHFKAENGHPVDSYRDVFEEDETRMHKRIVIQADPGCGKTTYVNKLALDWANEDEYLRKKFNFVFLIPLQTLTMDVLEAIKLLLPDETESEQFFASYAKSIDSKILLILDGFDELVENSQCYLSVMNILNGHSKQFLFFHLMVTTRRSHVEKIPQEFHGRSLLIKGFDVVSMKQFLNKQHVPLPSVGQQFNLIDLLQTPLFCAIYCSLDFGGGDLEFEDSYDLIKAFVENSVKNTVKKKLVLNYKNQLDEIGKFAFQKVDSKSLNFLKKFCRSTEVIKPSFDLSRVNLDLLIKRRIRTRGVGGFQEEFSLPHQLIVEYLGARYFARSLTKEQLKQADATAFMHIVDHVCPLNFPFVQILLFELLFLYLEKKYDESVFDNFLNIPELRFIWNIKSNKDIPTLDNVSDFTFNLWYGEFKKYSRFISTLSKCRNLLSLNLFQCFLWRNQVEQLANFINNNCFQNLIELELSFNENVGSKPQLFTALSKCKHLQVLDLQHCKLTVESITKLAICIDNNGLANLKQLNLCYITNVGSILFTALNECKHLQVLDLDSCEMTVKSTTELARCIDNNGLANLTKLILERNKSVGSTPQLFTALNKCKHLQVLDLDSCEMTVESTTELARCIDNNGLANLTKLILERNKSVGSTPQLFTALNKCKHLQVLDLDSCEMTVESTTELARCIDNNGLANLKQFNLCYIKNVGSIPQLFTAMNECKHLQVLDLIRCQLTVESTTELARCIDNNRLADLQQLNLCYNENVGSSTHLFHVLHKCRQLQRLRLDYCSITEESLSIFLSTFNSNTFQQLDYIYLLRNEKIKVDDNFLNALEKCRKISKVYLDKSMESDLSEVGRKAKETLEQRGCRFYF